MSLIALQRDMRDHLLAGEPAVAGHLRGDPQPGLAVYHNAYRAQLIDCLRDTYEKLSAWLGDEAFEAAARQHIEAHPPHSWTLGDYGADFAQTLAGLYPADPEVAELAWLDWSLRHAFDGPDAASLDPAVLADIDWDHAVFTLAPTLALGRLTTNAAALWSAMAEDQTPPAAALLSAPTDIRVWRQDLTSRFKSITAAETHALTLAAEGADFTQICLNAFAAEDEAQMIAAASEVLSAWIGEGVIAAVR